MNEPEDVGAIEQLLNAGSPVGAGEELRQSLLRRTRRVVRRRRRVRQAALVAAFIACYAGGLASARWISSRAPEPAQVIALPPPSPTPPAPKEVEPVAVARAASPVELEWQALDHPEKRWELYRRAGDLYLNESGDLQAALRCYRGALEAAPAEGLRVSAQDSWLLMALKEAKQKEKDHASTGS
jgi:hypothetical protein